MEEDDKIQKEFLNKIKNKSDYNTLLNYYNINKDKIDLNKNDQDKRKPLIHCITSKNYDAVKFLLENETVDKNISDSVRLLK
jgi:hypothetical protein